MKITPEEYLIAQKKYLESLTDEEREEIENRIRKAHLEAQLEAEKRGENFKEKYPHIIKIYEDNLHHIKAKDILEDGIHKAINNPEMTPEVKKIGEMFIYMLHSCDDSFDYTFDGAAKEIVDIARVEIPTLGGKMRAESDEKTHFLQEIEKEAIAKAKEFKRYGYQAKFAREMLLKYPKLEDDEAIKTRLRKLAKDGKIDHWKE